LHISTDAVFDGIKGGYVENDQTNPLSVYACTKLAGEEAVSAANPDSIIARVVFFGWSLSGSRSLSEFFFNHLKAGEPIKGFTDTFFSPLYVEHLAEILLEMVSSDLAGVFHVVSPEKLSKYDFGLRISNKFGFDPGLIEPFRGGEVDRGASRSLNLHLKPDKAQAALGYTFPSVNDGIDGMLLRWQEGYPAFLHNLAVI
jgi:dTDP-4-dehydrorhamnose reductase